MSDLERAVAVLRRYARMLRAMADEADLVADRLDPDAIRRHSRPLAATSLETVTSAPDSGLMTFDEAARVLGYSKRHLSRLAADDGPLVKVGRRLTVDSVEDLAGAR